MLSQKEAEAGLAYSLLKRPGENRQDALQRIALLPIDIQPLMIQDKAIRALMTMTLENGASDVATSTYLAAQGLSVDEFDLVQQLGSVDAEGLPIYCNAVRHYYQQREIRTAAEDAVQLAKGQEDPRKVLGQISQRFADLDMIGDQHRIGTIPQRSAAGEKMMQERQTSIKSGELRVSFPLPGLDRMLPYVLPGQVVLLTALTKVGKSSFAAQMFDYNVRRMMNGLYFHFEDTPEVMDIRRIARQMHAHRDEPGVVKLQDMLGKVFTKPQRELLKKVREDIPKWSSSGIEIYCAGWTMEQVCRVWRQHYYRFKAAGQPLDLVIIDYLNKAELTPGKLKEYGQFGARGRDAELVKRATEATGCVTLLVQQEGHNGEPYETQQSKQKSQAWISLVRERDENTMSLHRAGRAIVKNANMGATGAIPATFVPERMLWSPDDEESNGG